MKNYELEFQLVNIRQFRTNLLPYWVYNKISRKLENGGQP